MKPLILLIIAFAVYVILSKLLSGNFNFVVGGNLAMCLMLCLTAAGHFMFTRGMVMMMPPFIPLKKEVIYFTGIAEVVMGFALLSTCLRIYAGIILIIFFILIIPANIYASIKRIDLEKATYNGPGLNYLWFRIPLQLFFIAWVYYFAVY